MHDESPTEESPALAQRLQKVLASAGLGSRRDCEDLIREGRVEVDRRVVTELGTRVDPTQQEIRVDGESLRHPKRVYFAVNKPMGVVTTNRDPSGRPRVIDLVPTEERVFAVGRLDRSSEGLILVTNDGEFANRITHPRYGVEKTYLVRVAGTPEARQIARLKKGVHLAEGFARTQSVSVKKTHGRSTDMVIVLNEGRNREIRRILARVGHKVLALRRIAIGRLKLGDLPLGGWRRLMPTEIDGLLEAAKEIRRQSKPQDKSKVKTLTRRASESVKPTTDKPYLQKQALLSEPLSLDDLLRDDLDEGPIGRTSPNTAETASFGEDDPGEMQGGVIDYEGGVAKAPPSPPRHQGKREMGPKRRPGRGGPRQDIEARPRKSFGKKRGGKRVFGPQEQGRGHAAEKEGKSRFRPKPKKRLSKPFGADNQRRGERRGKKSEQQFGKQGGKRKGRR